jgi:lipid-A-disaccharide synthase
MSSPTIFISAGELSGDMHGGALVEAMKTLVPGTRFVGVGGDTMQRAGVELLSHLSNFGGVMGFSAVFKKLKEIYRIFRRCRVYLQQHRPQLLIVIDFPDFNLRLAKAAKKLDIPVLYFIPPKVWAWREGRVRDLKQACAHIATILPFEEAFYQKHQYEDVSFVGHPFCDTPSLHLSLDAKQAAKESIFQELGFDPVAPTLLVLAGSRKQEIALHMPVVQGAVEQMKRLMPALQVIFSQAPTIPSLSIAPQHASWMQCSTISSRTLMQICDAGIIKSGTSTLEAAFAALPSLCIYKTTPGAAFVARHLVGVSSIALPNLICEGTIPELVQDNCTVETVAREALSLFDPAVREMMMHKFQQVQQACQPSQDGKGSAYERVASIANKLCGEHQ